VLGDGSESVWLIKASAKNTMKTSNKPATISSRLRPRLSRMMARQSPLLPVRDAPPAPVPDFDIALLAIRHSAQKITGSYNCSMPAVLRL
jgi:hypothetical protein